MIVNITISIDGSPVSEMVNVNRNTVFLFIENVSARLNGKSVTCTAVLDTGNVGSCLVITLQVQGKSQL